MIPSLQKVDLFGVKYAVVDYALATSIILSAAAAKNRCGVSALAVHGLMEAYNDTDLRQLVNQIDLVVPDGQPVRWAMNALHDTKLKDRVYGPGLTVKVLEQCNNLGFKIFLFGSKQDTLEKLALNIHQIYPQIIIAGSQADRFRDATFEEDQADISLINGLEPNLVLVGRGCPRQEKWVALHLDTIQAPMMAVGAAFDFLAGTVSQAPTWMQMAGLEWFYRLCMEPQRLWKRYLFTNSQFIWLFAKAVIRNLFQNKKKD
jgi:exopolysaccharide biosynthesis WecB/TagA/CpsF family protein